MLDSLYTNLHNHTTRISSPYSLCSRRYPSPMRPAYCSALSERSLHHLDGCRPTHLRMPTRWKILLRALSRVMPGDGRLIALLDRRCWTLHIAPRMEEPKAFACQSDVLLVALLFARHESQAISSSLHPPLPLPLPLPLPPPRPPRPPPFPLGPLPCRSYTFSPLNGASATRM